MLFMLQQGSRNALNNKRAEKKFKQHYERLFQLRLPHLDTVYRVLCLPPCHRHRPNLSLGQLPRLWRPHPGVAGGCGSRHAPEEGQTTPQSVCPPDQPDGDGQHRSRPQLPRPVTLDDRK
jgi:hypothetical protein